MGLFKGYEGAWFGWIDKGADISDLERVVSEPDFKKLISKNSNPFLEEILKGKSIESILHELEGTRDDLKKRREDLDKRNDEINETQYIQDEKFYLQDKIQYSEDVKNLDKLLNVSYLSKDGGFFSRRKTFKIARQLDKKLDQLRIETIFGNTFNLDLNDQIYYAQEIHDRRGLPQSAYLLGRLLYIGSGGDSKGALDLSKKAFELFTHAYDLGFSSKQFYKDFSKVLMDNAEFQKGINILNEAIEMYPESFFINYHLGIMLKETGKVEDSIPYFEKAVERKPDHAYANINLGDSLDKVGRKKEAESYFVKGMMMFYGVKGKQEDRHYALAKRFLGDEFKDGEDEVSRMQDTISDVLDIVRDKLDGEQ